ncbi:hypothetical protein [Bradyrhizobium betae]|uniref:Uncharacterized protein n=1 Tax=Bradyrhizobium betae TaxID=244734 RepID=A0A5P6P9X2_9BRAD|nr:hypothetical protein [Bradyrhizobium betae]MCS3727240.1 hypothetical protein [Bradyrhizobium betae]QFI74848.1 hypothetical protein F8237_22030 [Bradyrhizobium betae]
MRDWIVMTASGQMPSRCKGRYRRVAVVEIEEAGIVPKMISERAKGVRRIVRDYGPKSVGKTEACAYQRTLVVANAFAERLRGQHAAAIARVADALNGGMALSATEMAMLD